MRNPKPSDGDAFVAVFRRLVSGNSAQTGAEEEKTKKAVAGIDRVLSSIFRKENMDGDGI